MAWIAGAGLLTPALFAQERGGTDDPKRWQAVAPGRVEPWSGEIKITAAAIGAIGELLVKPTDKVFAGELLIRLRDEEVVTRLATAEAQVAMRKAHVTTRPPEPVPTAGEPRIWSRRSAGRHARRDRHGLDCARLGWLGGDVQAARASTRARTSGPPERADLKRLLATAAPLPVAVDGQLNIARTSLRPLRRRSRS
jgi:multidrug efflux pump subunit AcrA (membrane-fusion protein)